MNDSYTERMPLGPHNGGDSVGEQQVGDAWYRRFVREVRDTGYGGRAMAHVCFFVQDVIEFDRPRRVLTRKIQYLLCRDATDPVGTTTYESTVYEECPTFGAEPTEADAKAACEKFEPSPPELDWDGWPGAEKSCLTTTHTFAESAVAAYCATHGQPLYTNSRRDFDTALSGFVCDRGRGWTFLVDDGTSEDPAPRLVDLSGLNRALIGAIEAAHYGDDHSDLRIWRYLRPGELQPLDWGRVPGDEDHRGFVNDDEQRPLMIDQRWQVCTPTLGVHPNEPDDLVYLRTVISLNGDA